MHINLLGINYQTAPINIRERAAISIERLPDALAALRKYVEHGVILSTCNRTEVYASGSDSSELTKACEKYFKDYLHILDGNTSPFVYKETDEALVKHLFRVASGLNSMIIGEYEVLGQVKQCFDAADKMGMVNLVLRHVFHSAIRTGRVVREETGISKYALSVSSVAVNKALDINHDIDKSKLVIIGAGEAARQAVRVARSRGMTKIVIVSRTEGRAISLTNQCGGRPVGTDKLANEICDADIVIACAASPHAVLHYKHVADAMSRRSDLPMIIIDIAMPRNVEPSVKEITNVHLFNIDDLNELADKNRSQREKETAAVEKIILQETEMLMKWWRVYSVRPAVKALMSKAERIRSSQYNKSMKRLISLSDEEKKSVDLLTMSIVDKILRDPIIYLKLSGENGDGAERAEIVKELFKLDDVKDNE
jgi:glutamyl-tRNA reductase